MKDEFRDKRIEVTKMILSGKTYKEVATFFNCTRQNIQLLNKPDSDTISAIKKRSNGKCEECKESIKYGHIHHIDKICPESYQQLSNLMYLCVSCHRKKHINESIKVFSFCKQCGSQFRKYDYYGKNQGLFCSKECRQQYFFRTLNCSICNKTFLRRKSHYERSLENRKFDGFVCSKECWGKYIGKNNKHSNKT